MLKLMYLFLEGLISSKRYKFLVDTGSNITFILKLKSSFDELRFGRKKWVRFKNFLLPTIQKKVLISFGKTIIKHPIIIPLWEKYLEYAANFQKNIQIYMYFQQFKYDAILGVDLLKKLVLKLNLQKNIAAVVTKYREDKYYQYSLHSIRNYIALPLEINAKKHYAIIDTGINVADIVLHKKPKKSKSIARKEVYLWNKKRKVEIYELREEVKILDRAFKNLKFMAYPITPYNHPLICYPLLKRFKQIIIAKGETLLLPKS
jgi:hypothetical protein